ncbi:23S rRNA (uracil(1939)-C(5))-methyltransferase RlmD [Flavobacteriaceae bacterium Ap0902]|nr:23S rRNA (uracil(1939)-C(5))-methyltransferase RlmD [Flavobacteriaceae bacterium Ap0902]
MSRKNRGPFIIQDIELFTAGSKGAAIGKTKEGKTVLVKNGVPGDVVDIRVTKKNRKYIQGTVVAIHKKSEYRKQPECHHFGICGGCKWQNMRYDIQLHYKHKEVKDHLERIGKVSTENMAPIIGSEEIYFYRNKMEFSFSNQSWITEEEIKSGKEIKDRDALGFHIPGMWSKILDIEKCWLQTDPSNTIRNEVKNYAKANDLEFFDPVAQSGFLRTLMIRTSTTGEVMVLFQLFKEDQDAREALLNHIQSKFPAITSILYAINPKGNDSVYDLDIQTYAGQDYITEEMEGLKFKIGPKSFYQTNPKQAETLYNVARDFADLKGDEVVYDLYTGTGTIAQFVSKKAKKVVGVESVQEAINAAKENAKANGIENTAFICGDMKDVFTHEFVQLHGRPNVIITDPPRDGMHQKVIENILNIAPEKVVYVSCNSATQARDLALMKEHYAIEKIQPVDMFPQTHHVENVALLTKKK